MKNEKTKIKKMKQVLINTDLPKALIPLKKLSENLWWSWNYEASELFELVDERLWIESDKNPKVLILNLSPPRIAELNEDKGFLKKLKTVYYCFEKYMKKKKNEKTPDIAYFCMEYGLDDNIKIYSGGLGILAGDYMKEASDMNINMTGIGLLYRYGYFDQKISIAGRQLDKYFPQDFNTLPVEAVKDSKGNDLIISVELSKIEVFIKIWKLPVGRINLFLLDTDFDLNSKEERSLTYKLYGGDDEYRLKQEMILGLGGIRALEALNLKPDLYHCNEGHAAFIGPERISRLMENDNLSYKEATEVVRASTLFTTHTPVEAGHDTFEEKLLKKYINWLPQKLGITWKEFLALGKVTPSDRKEKFSMSYLALKMSQEVNGVSYLHGEVSKELFEKVYGNFFKNELFIDYVTNGVHYPTWTAKGWRELYEKELGFESVYDFLKDDNRLKVNDISDKKIWELKDRQRKILFNFIKKQFRENWENRKENPAKISRISNKLDDKVLTIGFARRFAPYKRAHLLFRDLEKLARIVNNEERPIQFLFSGKAHPNDTEGQKLIKYVIEMSKKPEFEGKILFLENYNISLAKKMVQGVDIWMNTPTRPLEASGTSGEKSVMNGGLHFSVLDGWWVEGYRDGAGWALEQERTYIDQERQNNVDAEIIYNLLEYEIAPLFYERNKENISEGWVKYVKKSISEVAPEFSTRRMFEDYINKFYDNQYERSNNLIEKNFDLAIKISAWKKIVTKKWDGIKIISSQIPVTDNEKITSGNRYDFKVSLDTNGLNAEDIAVELLLAEPESAVDKNIVKEKFRFKATKQIKKSKESVYTLEFIPENPGSFSYGVRVVPAADFLPHDQDMNLAKWV